MGETNHVLISGASDSGKDNLAWWMLLSLGLAHPDPAQLQVAILDGKGLDFQPWAGKAQTWALASDPEEIPTVLRALSAERQRRKALLSSAGVSKWDHYQGGDLPLLVVFISELSLTVRAPYLRDAERRHWLALLPARRGVEQPADPLLQHYLDVELDAPEAPEELSAPAPTSLSLSPADIAAIGARIALGHTKTAVVRAMPGYETLRHREFAAYYDGIVADLSTQGLAGRRARDGIVSSEG